MWNKQQIIIEHKLPWINLSLFVPHSIWNPQNSICRVVSVKNYNSLLFQWYLPIPSINTRWTHEFSLSKSIMEWGLCSGSIRIHRKSDFGSLDPQDPQTPFMERLSSAAPFSKNRLYSINLSPWNFGIFRIHRIHRIQAFLTISKMKTFFRKTTNNFFF